MIDFDKLKNILQQHNSVLLTTHVNPDADAIGSEIALFKILKRIGKQVHIINSSSTPYNLTFLDKENKIEQYKPEKNRNIIKLVELMVGLVFKRSDRLSNIIDELI